MTQFKPYDPSDRAEAVALWNESFNGDFPMDLRLWEQNIDRSPFLWAKASQTARDESGALIGILIVKKPSNLCCIFVGPGHRRAGIATQLYERSNAVKKRKDARKWTVGQDRNHLFPGVPTESADALAFFETGLHFKRDPGLIYDLHRSLEGYSIAPEVQARIQTLAGEGIAIGPCRKKDVESLTEHIDDNFSARWAADTATRLAAEGSPAQIMVARTGKKEKVIGFAHIFTRESKYLGPSVYWRALLGEDYGGLGPIGVDKDYRKIGLGLALLSASIQRVKDCGATQMAIDWTVLVDFYAKVGFTPWKTYYAVRQ